MAKTMNHVKRQKLVTSLVLLLLSPVLLVLVVVSTTNLLSVLLATSGFLEVGEGLH